jgi:hypothetical protein
MGIALTCLLSMPLLWAALRLGTHPDGQMEPWAIWGAERLFSKVHIESIVWQAPIVLALIFFLRMAKLNQKYRAIQNFFVWMSAKSFVCMGTALLVFGSFGFLEFRARVHAIITFGICFVLIGFTWSWIFDMPNQDSGNP